MTGDILLQRVTQGDAEALEQLYERHGKALDQLGHFGADHVRAEKLAGFCVEDGLDQTFRLAHGDSLAVGHIGEPPNANLAALFLGGLFGHAEGRNLGPAIGTAGNLRHIQRVGF